MKNGIICWNLRSTIVTNGIKFKTHKYTNKEVDYFVLYHSIRDILLIVPYADVQNKVSISFTYPFKIVKSTRG